jgi:hypothetical protein
MRDVEKLKRSRNRRVASYYSSAGSRRETPGKRRASLTGAPFWRPSHARRLVPPAFGCVTKSTCGSTKPHDHRTKGVRKIAEEFGVSPGTAEAISPRKPKYPVRTVSRNRQGHLF